MYDQVVAGGDVFNDNRIHWISDTTAPATEGKVGEKKDHERECKIEGECTSQRECCEGHVCMRFDKSKDVWYCINKEKLYD